MVCSGAIFNYLTMADSGVINSGHEPNSVQSLLQCPFERRTLAEKLKVKELGPDQPDGLIYCEELFVKLFTVPVCHSPTSKKIHQPPLTGTPTELGFSQGFFRHSVTDGVLVPCRCRLRLLSWGHFISSDIDDLIAHILFKLY